MNLKSLKGFDVMELDKQLIRLNNQLVTRGYSIRTIRLYEQCWIHLRRVAQDMNLEKFTEELAEAFIDDRKKHSRNFERNEKKYLRCMEMIRYFLIFDDIPYVALRLESLSDYYQSILDSYLAYAMSLNQSKSTLKTKKSRIRKFLLYLESQNIEDIRVLTADSLLDFMNLLNTNYSSSYTRGGILYSLRDFLHFCSTNYDTSIKLPSLIKKIHTNPNETLPSVFSPSEIQLILQSVDRTTSFGKRTFAMLILFTSLGLRSSDIINLKMSSINWENNTLDFFQHKTGIFCEFFLMEATQMALMDYIKAYRMDAEPGDYLFVRTRAPLGPLQATAGIYYLISNHIKKSGVEIQGRSMGPHALRHSMASRMLHNEVELPIISQALGHSSTQNTTRYLTIDMDRLRSIALEVPL